MQQRGNQSWILFAAPSNHNWTFSQWMDFCNVFDLFILFTNQDDQIQYINPAMAKHFEQNDNPIGRPFKDYFTPVQSSQPKNSWNLFYHNGADYFIKKVKTLLNEKMNIYLIIPKTELSDILSNLDIYQAYREELQTILDCIHDGIYITDGNGTTMLVNKEAEKTGGLSAEELLGRNMADLVKEGYCSESVSLKVIEQGKPVSIIKIWGRKPIDRIRHPLLQNRSRWYHNGKGYFGDHKTPQELEQQ